MTSIKSHLGTVVTVGARGLPAMTANFSLLIQTSATPEQGGEDARLTKSRLELSSIASAQAGLLARKVDLMRLSIGGDVSGWRN